MYLTLITHIINLILNRFDLLWFYETDQSLYYVTNVNSKLYKKESERLYYITNDVETIFNFLNLNYTELKKCTSMFKLVTILGELPYVDSKLLPIKDYKLMKTDNEKAAFKLLYKKLKHKKDIFYIPLYYNDFIPSLLENKFKDCNISNLIKSDENGKILFKYKFNCNIIKENTDLIDGSALGSTKDGFIESIETSYYESFNSYIARTTKEQILEDFMRYYDPLSFSLSK